MFYRVICISQVEGRTTPSVYELKLQSREVFLIPIASKQHIKRYKTTLYIPKKNIHRGNKMKGAMTRRNSLVSSSPGIEPRGSLRPKLATPGTKSFGAWAIIYDAAR